MARQSNCRITIDSTLEISDVLARLDRIEEAISILAGELGDGDDTEDTLGCDCMTHDDPVGEELAEREKAERRSNAADHIARGLAGTPSIDRANIISMQRAAEKMRGDRRYA